MNSFILGGENRESLIAYLKDPAGASSKLNQEIVSLLDRLEEPDDENSEAYIKAARQIHGSDGEIEVDDGAVVSISDDGGAYVQGWLWVYDTDAGLESEEEEEEEEPTEA